MNEPTPLEPHYWLAAISRETGSNCALLRGALADSGNVNVNACPDEISEIVASKYAITECGRLFHWRYGKLREVKPSRSTRDRQRFPILINGFDWNIELGVLLDRVFPGRKIQRDVAWGEYTEKYLEAIEQGDDAPIPGLEDDPLRDRKIPLGAPVKKTTATGEQIDRAWPLWYGD